MAFQYAGADPAVPRGKYFTIVYFSVGNQTYPGRERFLTFEVSLGLPSFGWTRSHHLWYESLRQI